jgi:hypothetical protein
VLTTRRLLLFRTSLWANRPSGLGREIPLGSIASITIGKASFFSPQPVAIALADGAKMTLESARQERPAELAEAFSGATGR